MGTFGGSSTVAVEDEGTPVVALAAGLDFTGAGVTATDGGGGVATIDIPGAMSVATEDENGSVLLATAILNFMGAGVTATDAGGGQVDVTIPGGGGDVAVEEEGVSVLAAATTFDFVGAGVTATDSGGGTATITIPGGGTGTPIPFSGAHLTRTGVQSIPNATLTLLTWNVETFDTDGFHESVINPGRITVPAGEAGYYLVVGTVGLEAFPQDADFVVEVGKNGSAINTARSRLRPGGPASVENVGLTSTALVYLAVGDWVGVHVEQSSGSAKNIQNATSSLSVAKLDPGISGSGGPVSGVVLGKSANQTVADSSTTAITWDEEDYDSNGYHESITNPTRITIPAGKAGLYLVTGTVHWNGVNPTTSHYYLRKNGTTSYPGGDRRDDPAASGGLTALVNLEVGDYIEFMTFQTGGSNAVRGGNNSWVDSQFSAILLQSGGGSGGAAEAFVWDPVALDYVEGGRIFIGPEDPDVQYTPQAGDAWLNPDELGAAPGRLLGITEYSVPTTYTATSTPYSDMDAANLAVTFVVPASGSVLIKLSAAMTAALGNQLGWGIRENTTDIDKATIAYAGASGVELRGNVTFLINGLTPGATKTYKWAHARVWGSGSTTTVITSDTGSAIMEVYDAATSTGAPEYRDSALLGLTAYDPAVQGTYTTTTTMANVDATNVKVTFTVPASGRVLIKVALQGYPNAGGSTLRLALLEGVTVVGAAQQVADSQPFNQVDVYRREWLITGLTPGTTKTYTLAAQHVTAARVLRWGGGSNGSGPAILEAWDPSIGGGITVPMVDDDTFATALATTVPSSESVKAFVNRIGTWTPTITAGSGTFTTTTGSGSYVRTGVLVTFTLDVQITNNGTAGTSVIATLPFQADGSWMIVGREYQATGIGVFGQISGGVSTITIRKVDNNYPGATGHRFTMSGTYRTNAA